MKNLYKAASALFMASIAMNVSAQQIPNGGFETGWAIKVPWVQAREALVSKPNDYETRANLAQEKQLIAPESWDASNNTGGDTNKVIKVLERIKGGHDGSKFAVKITDLENEAFEGLMFPGYISLGTAWFTTNYNAGIPFFGIPASATARDWGTRGGIEFTNRPDAVSFYYQRPAGEGASVVAYLWKGTFSQSVPAIINSNPNFHAYAYPDYAGGPLEAIVMENRDRAVLGMETAQGGEITKSDDAELIGVLNTRIMEEAADWTRFEAPIEYKSDATPTMFNLIIAAGNYFGENEKFAAGDNITVDDVTLLYYSRLQSVKAHGKTYQMEDGVYEYDLAGEIPADLKSIELNVLGQEATVNSITSSNGKVIVIVGNTVGEDNDGQTSHTYTFNFVGGTVTPDPVEGNTDIELYTYKTTDPNPGQSDNYYKAIDKLAAAKGNISYDEANNIYTIENYLGYDNANITFNVNYEAGATKSDGVVNYPINFTNETVAGNADIATLDNIITKTTLGIYPILDPDVTVAAQTQYIVNPKNNDNFRSIPFMGETTDYILMRPSIMSMANNTMYSYAQKEGDVTKLYLYITSRGQFTKEAGADAWGDFQSTNYGYMLVYTLPSEDGAGVEGIEIEENNDAPVEYYNLQGVRVENPAAGLYIRRQGNKVQKVVIR